MIIKKNINTNIFRGLVNDINFRTTKHGSVERFRNDKCTIEFIKGKINYIILSICEIDNWLDFKVVDSEGIVLTSNEFVGLIMLVYSDNVRDLELWEEDLEDFRYDNAKVFLFKSPTDNNIFLKIEFYEL